MAPRKILSLLWPSMLAVLLAVAALFGNAALQRYQPHWHPDVHTAIQEVTQTGFWLCIGWLVSRLVDVFFWWGLVERTTGQRAPRLPVAMLRFAIVAVVLAIIASAVFHQPLNGLLLSSGAIGVVVGLGIQRMISDAFSGIALSVERPFRVGEWIDVDGVTGEVIETNWRATHLVTHDQITVVIPNSYIAERRFLNYSLPEGFFRTDIKVLLETNTKPTEAKQVLLAAIRETPGVLTEPPPDVILYEFAPDGILYKARFFIHSYRDLTSIRDQVSMAIYRHVYQAGFNMPYPKRDVYHLPMPAREIDPSTRKDLLLSRMELFAGLQASELRTMAESLRELTVAEGEVIVRQGEAGDTMFLIVHGLVQASLYLNGKTTELGNLGPGEYFGEMSLLTGEPRGATITALTASNLYELPRHVVKGILQQRPEIAESIGRRISMRLAENFDRTNKPEEAPKPAAKPKSFPDLVKGIRSLFGLSDAGGRGGRN